MWGVLRYAMTLRYCQCCKWSFVSEISFPRRIVTDVCSQLPALVLEQQLPGKCSCRDVTPLCRRRRRTVRWSLPPSQRSDCRLRPLAFPLPAVQCGRRSPSPQVPLTSDLWYFWDPIHTNRAFRSTEIPARACPPQFWISANVVEKCSHFFQPCAGHPHYVMIMATNHLCQRFGRHKSPLVWQVIFYRHLTLTDIICTLQVFVIK
jgi:hypothetical protein